MWVDRLKLNDVWVLGFTILIISTNSHQELYTCITLVEEITTVVGDALVKKIHNYLLQSTNFLIH